jgi:hypothetical protein
MSENLAVQITNVIAETRGVQTEELDYTLQDYIEMDALERLAEGDTGPWTLSFECPDGTVVITSNDGIDVEVIDEGGQTSGQVSVR